MTDRRRHVTTAARARGCFCPLVRTGVLILFAAVGLSAPARTQDVTWEMMPPVPPSGTFQQVHALGFLRGEGAAAADPAADTLVVFHEYAVLLYNPSGAAGAAGNNGSLGPWHRLCASGLCIGRAGLVTSSGTILVGSGAGATQLSRGTNRGRTWLLNYDDIGADPFFETTVPSAAGPAGEPAVIVGSGDGGETRRSTADGAPGTWTRGGSGRGFPESFGEVPASAALPGGRVLIGVVGGISYSDDGGLSYLPTSTVGSGRYYIAWSFTFVPDAGHPFGGVVYAGVQNIAAGGEGGGAEVLRSDDGGRTWTLAHAFTAAEMEVPVPAGTDMSDVIVLATPDGAGGQALWAGVSQSTGSSNPPRGGIMRSVDGGATWQRADAGFRNAQGWGHQVRQFALSRTGVLYAATFRGVWRTTGAVVAGEASPEAPVHLGVSVRPNPAGGRVAVVLRLAEASTVRVVVLDARGREVAVVVDGDAPGGALSFAVDTSSWPTGVYIVRATTSGGRGAQTSTARLVVAR